MAAAVAVHDDGTDCAHDGPPFMAGARGPAMCAAGICVTHIRVPAGRLIPLSEAVTAVQSVANTLAAGLTPLVAAATGFARSAADRPALAALAAAASVLDVIASVQRAAQDSTEPPGQDLDPCGNGPLGYAETGPGNLISREYHDALTDPRRTGTQP